MTLLETVLEKREALLDAARRHGASNVRLFGSVIHGAETAASDIDILVDLDEKRGFSDYLALAEEMETLLGRKVDLVTTRGVSPYLRPRIEREARPL